MCIILYFLFPLCVLYKLLYEVKCLPTIFHCLLFFLFSCITVDVKKLSLVLKVDENMIEQCFNCSTLFIIVNNVEQNMAEYESGVTMLHNIVDHH